MPMSRRFSKSRRVSLALAAALAGAALPAHAEDARPRVIETPPLKLFGDGAAPRAQPPAEALAITTPPLRLVGDSAAAQPDKPAPPALTIETRPLKLIGAKP